MTNDDDFLTEQHGGVVFLDDQTASPRNVLAAIERIERQYDVAELRGEVVHVPNGWV